ncbi:reverse transcriptase domain-containing protein [Tanacetum coccineum]
MFIGGLPQSIEGNVTASKPQTLEEAINIAQRLMDQLYYFYDIEMDDGNLSSPDVVIGMDWLSKYHARIICDEKVVHIPIDGETLIIRRLTNILNNGKEVGREMTGRHTGSQRIPEVFPEDLPGLPPVRQVEFQIDLNLGSKTYWTNFKVRSVFTQRLTLEDRLSSMRVRGRYFPRLLSEQDKDIMISSECHLVFKLCTCCIHGFLMNLLELRQNVRSHPAYCHFTPNSGTSYKSALGTQLDMSTAYHPETDGQSERTIQTLEDMLRACVIDFGKGWERHLPLVEFSYNNSYHANIKAAPFEALYGRKYRSPVCWAEVGDVQLQNTRNHSMNTT